MTASVVVEALEAFRLKTADPLVTAEEELILQAGPVVPKKLSVIPKVPWFSTKAASRVIVSLN